MSTDYSLEHFELKGLDQGRLTGVSMAVHAISDGFLLMHCGVGCKHKATSQLATHDWQENVVNRRGWTEVGDAELIEGSADRIGPYLRTWHDRQSPGVMMVISVTFLDLTGDDFRDACRQTEKELSCPVLWVPAPGYDGDMFSGYASATVEVVGALDWTESPSKPNSVALLGYLFDRYEGDHQGNLLQLKGLMKGLGLELGPVLFFGARVRRSRHCARFGSATSVPLCCAASQEIKAFVQARPRTG